MFERIKIVSLLLMMLMLFNTSKIYANANTNDSTNQAIVVVGTGGYKVDVLLYEKDNSGKWNKTISTKGFVGKNGITDNKREGDGKTPSGVYSLGTGFGIASNPGVNINYRKVTNNDYWVDDPNSKYYNQWVDITKVQKDWNSAEHLYAYKTAYKYGVVINYNTENIVPGKGSAIFLHNSTGSYTAGCVSVSESNLVNIMKRLTQNSKIVIAKDYNSIPMPPKDDIKGHWAENEIRDFVNKGYINGYGDGIFRPNNNITRAEFVKIFNKYFGLTQKSGKSFSDTAKHWAKDEIDIAVTNGVVNGFDDNTFRPNEPITREQAAKLISNYKKLEDTDFNKLNSYKDSNDVSNWAKTAVEGVLEAGYMKGYADNTYRPKNNITRAEAVVTLSRILK